MTVPGTLHAGRPLRARASRELLVDAAVACATFALTVTTGPRDDLRAFDAAGLLLAALASAPLLARRQAPLAVFAIVAVAGAALLGLGYSDGSTVGTLVALYSIAAAPEEALPSARWTAAVTAVAFGLQCVAFAVQQHDGYPGVPPIPFTVLFWLAAWTIGERVRRRRVRVAAEAEQAARAAHDVERERRLAAAEERARIARDLHDAAGHAISVILVEAGVARLLHARDPARARAAIDTIEAVARDTVGEIDELVRTLRSEPAEGAEPPAGLDALDTLVARHRAAGLRVTTDVRPAAQPLPRAIDRAAYRILQEALTNAARHGGGRARVEVVAGADALALAVTNPLAAASRDDGRGGHGITGMRERATLLGGSLEAAAEDGEFRVRARLPYEGARG